MTGAHPLVGVAGDQVATGTNGNAGSAGVRAIKMFRFLEPSRQLTLLWEQAQQNKSSFG